MFRVMCAWVAFTIGVLFVTVDIVRLNITGLFLTGVIALAVWFFLIGGNRPGFWITAEAADRRSIRRATRRSVHAVRKEQGL